MSLHGLTSMTLGVPDVDAVASYYEDFGLRRVGDRPGRGLVLAEVEALKRRVASVAAVAGRQMPQAGGGIVGDEALCAAGEIEGGVRRSINL